MLPKVFLILKRKKVFKLNNWIVDIPANYGSLIQGYTFIYGVDDPNKDYKIPDQFDAYEVALLVYKNISNSHKVGRLALDLRE